MPISKTKRKSKRLRGGPVPKFLGKAKAGDRLKGIAVGMTRRKKTPEGTLINTRVDKLIDRGLKKAAIKKRSKGLSEILKELQRRSKKSAQDPSQIKARAGTYSTKRKSGRGLAASMAKNATVFKRLNVDQKRKVLELAIEAFGIDGLKGQKHLGLSKGGFPDLSGDGKTTQKDILIGRGVIKAKAGTLATKAKSTIKKVAGKLTKASKAHAGQAKTLSKVIKAKPGALITKKKKGAGPVPKNKSLYATVKAEAKKKFDVYPSAYANAWLVKTYKARGGTYA